MINYLSLKYVIIIIITRKINIIRKKSFKKIYVIKFTNTVIIKRKYKLKFNNKLY